MDQKQGALTEKQRTAAEVVADIIKGVPVSAQEFFEIVVSTYKSGLQDGRKVERNLQQMAAGSRQAFPGV